MEQSAKDMAHAEILHFFRYTYRDIWAPGHIFDGKSRVWVAVFNKLISQGFIERRKVQNGYEYKWKAVFPEGL
jgi:hypothetical protein